MAVTSDSPVAVCLRGLHESVTTGVHRESTIEFDTDVEVCQVYGCANQLHRHAQEGKFTQEIDYPRCIGSLVSKDMTNTDMEKV